MGEDEEFFLVHGVDHAIGELFRLQYPIDRGDAVKTAGRHCRAHGLRTKDGDAHALVAIADRHGLGEGDGRMFGGGVGGAVDLT